MEMQMGIVPFIVWVWIDHGGVHHSPVKHVRTPYIINQDGCYDLKHNRMTSRYPGIQMRRQI